MTANIHITQTSDDAANEAVLRMLASYNAQILGREVAAASLHRTDMTVVAHRGTDVTNVVGGLVGTCAGAWFNIAVLVVEESLRRTGLGSHLLTTAEAGARSHGCENSYVVTLDFQAPDFYVRHGYTVGMRFPNWRGGHERIILAKSFGITAARPEAAH